MAFYVETSTVMGTTVIPRIYRGNGNHCCVNTAVMGKLSKIIYKESMESMEEILAGYPVFFQDLVGSRSGRIKKY